MKNPTITRIIINKDSKIDPPILETEEDLQTSE